MFSDLKSERGGNAAKQTAPTGAGRETMAGYSGFSMSNNAVAAYESGMLPASKLAARIGRGATAAGVAAVLMPSEWHHTSKNYNRTDFYDFRSAAENRAGEREIEIEDAEDEIEAEIIAASKALKSAKSEARRLVAECTEKNALWTLTPEGDVWIHFAYDLRRADAATWAKTHIELMRRALDDTAKPGYVDAGARHDAWVEENKRRYATKN